MNASEKGTIVVTGGADSFGRVLVPYLVARGFDVHAVDRRHRPACPPGATYHRVNFEGAAKAIGQRAQ
jgi:nucleoside-diphosphate-sugar epimerase